MTLSQEDFELLITNQYCDDPSCSHYQEVGAGNLKIYCRKYNQVYCNGSCAGRPFVVTKGTVFYGLKTPLKKVVETLSLLARGIGVNNTCAEQGVSADSVLAWIVKAGNHVNELTAYMQHDMQLDQVQIDEFWSYVLKKKNLTDEELARCELDVEFAAQRGDRWTFVAVLPRSGFVHTVHHGKRTSEEALEFVQKIKRGSDGQAPLVLSDAWFYDECLFNTYCRFEDVPYKGRGRRPHPKRVVDQQLMYAQVYKKRDSKGKILEIQTRIVKGDEQEILDVIRSTSRAKMINTSYVESRNGKYRKDDARLNRDAACHSKKPKNHDAHIDWLTAVFKFCRENASLKEEINPNAKRFEQKYKRCSPAMAEGLTDKILPVKELLSWRPRKRAP